MAYYWLKDRVIEAVGAGVNNPQRIYRSRPEREIHLPGLIDAYTTYGMPEAPRQAFGGRLTDRAGINQTGAYGWNEAINPK